MRLFFNENNRMDILSSVMLNLPITAFAEKGSALVIRIKQLCGCKKVKINYLSC